MMIERIESAANGDPTCREKIIILRRTHKKVNICGLGIPVRIHAYLTVESVYSYVSRRYYLP